MQPRADLSDWLAVAAGTLGAFMAMVDVSIVNAALPVIQGEIGATLSEGTWIGTSYLIAEIVVIPLTAWLERLLGLRRLLLTCTVLFTGFSIVCGLSSTLEMMIIGRIGQGLAGGVLIPTALTIVARRLPPAQQSVGLAIAAMTALVGPAIGPLLGGWLTENWSWHYAFFINVPFCIVQGALLLVAIAPSPSDLGALRNADWFGIGGMVLGLGALTTLLEEGQREQWFDSPLIVKLALASALGFALVGWGQLRAAQPVIQLALLRNRSLASAVVLMGAVGMMLYTSLYMTPQFLAAIAGYNALQSGQVAFIAAAAAVPASLFYLVLAMKLDGRVIVVGAMVTIALGAYLASHLTAQSTSEAFTGSQMLYGIGTTLSVITLQQAVISSVSLDDTAEANSLMSVARNLGGSIGLAVLAGFQERRLDLHHWQLNAGFDANDTEIQRQLGEAAAALGGGADGLSAAYTALDGQVLVQALVMTFNDMFLALAVVGLLFVPLAWFLRTPRPGAGMAVGAIH